MTKNEAMQMALQKIEYMLRNGEWYEPEKAIEALEAALAQPDPEPEPVAIVQQEAFGRGQVLWVRPASEFTDGTKLYTASPAPTKLINVNGVLEQAGYVKKKEWVGLTKEELAEISEFHFHGAFSGREVYEDIETRLKEKNT